MNVVIYHNPRCSKSRQTLALIRERGIEPEIIEYLKTPPDLAELKRIIALLGMTAHQVMRSGESEYRELGLGGDDREDKLLQAMVAHPRLIERPIVVVGEQARLGRPPEQVIEILP
jgi:arsenate reductase (glutaredoxin)